MPDKFERSRPVLMRSQVVQDDSLEADASVRHAFFTREGGVSEGLYAGLNAGIGSADEPERVARNRARACLFLGAGPDRLATPWQIHSPDAVIVEAPFAGERAKADGIATRVSGLAVGVVTADCGPILFADARAGVVAAAHAGWKGALGGVIEATLEAMERLGSARGDVRTVLGPTITQPNYEVGVEMMRAVIADDPDRERFFAPGAAPEKRQFDLPGFILSRLAAAGVGSARFVGACTYGAPERFFSFRRTTHRGEPDYGRQLSAIMIQG